MKDDAPIQTCPWCQRATQPIWVHGQAQCQHCRTAIDPCRGGEVLIASGGDPDAFRLLRRR